MAGWKKKPDQDNQKPDFRLLSAMAVARDARTILFENFETALTLSAILRGKGYEYTGEELTESFLILKTQMAAISATLQNIIQELREDIDPKPPIKEKPEGPWETFTKEVKPMILGKTDHTDKMGAQIKIKK